MTTGDGGMTGESIAGALHGLHLHLRATGEAAALPAPALLAALSAMPGAMRLLAAVQHLAEPEGDLCIRLCQ